MFLTLRGEDGGRRFVLALLHDQILNQVLFPLRALEIQGKLS